MRIALVNAAGNTAAAQAYPPLGLAALAAYLRVAEPGAQVRIFADGEEAAAFAPHLTGISSVTETFGRARAIARVVRARTASKVVVGGIHITMHPASLSEEFDAGVLGEGEETFAALAQNLDGDWRAIAGVALPGGGSPALTSPRRSIARLDTLPFPDRTALAEAFPPKSEMHLHTSRGCIHSCSFCSATRFWKSYRAFSAPYVEREIRAIIDEFAPASLKFFDDLFTADRARLAALSAAIAGSDIPGRVSFSAYIRAGDFDENACAQLRTMGVTAVSFGAESASQRILNTLKGSRARIEDNERTLALCRRAGLLPSASFVIGVPGERNEDLEATRAFILRNEDILYDVSVFPLVPYPGTRWWNDAVAKGAVSSAAEDWSRFSILLDDFDPAAYPYLNGDVVPIDAFVKWVDEFKALERAMKPYPDRVARIVERFGS